MMTLHQADGLDPALPGARRCRLRGRLAPLLCSACTPTAAACSAGDLFVALRGERMDAHDFLPQAHRPARLAACVETGRSQPVCLHWCPTPPQGPRRAGRRLAQPVWPALDCRDRQQWQDHGHADAGQHPAGAAGEPAWPRAAISTMRWRAADPVAPDVPQHRWPWSSWA